MDGDNIMNKTLPIGTKVKITNLNWGEGVIEYRDTIMGKTGTVIDHDDDYYTPPNIVEIDDEINSYFLAAENLKVI